MRLRTICKLWYLAASWPRVPGVTRTFAVGDDGGIDILLECGIYTECYRIPARQRITMDLVWQLDALVDRLLDEAIDGLSLDDARLTFESAIDRIGKRY